MTTRHIYDLHIGTTLTTAVRLNGITIQRGSSASQDGITGAADHLLQPGQNELSIEVLEADRESGSAFILARVVRAADGAELEKVEWTSRDPDPLPPAPPYPIVRTVSFELPDDHPPPPWDGAEVERMPEVGTDEAWRPVRELHEAMARGDKDAVHASLETRAAEYYRIHENPAVSPAGARRMVDEMMVGPYEMAPIGPENLEFRSVAGGRAVQVLRRGGGSAIQGRAVGAPKIGYVADPLLVRRDGVWTIVG